MQLSNDLSIERTIDSITGSSSSNADKEEGVGKLVYPVRPPFEISSEEKPNSGFVKKFATCYWFSPCPLFVATLIGLSVLIAGLVEFDQITKNGSDPSKDFVLVDGVCSVTNVEHEAITQFYDSGGVGYRRRLRSLRQEEMCRDKYTLNFTAPDDNFSTIHRSVTRYLDRCFDCSCDNTTPLAYSSVLGIGDSGKCWKSTSRLEGKTGKYLKQCGEKLSAEGSLHCHEDMKKDGLIYECGDLACYKIVDPNEFYGSWIAHSRGMMIGGGVVAAFFILVFGIRFGIRKNAGLQAEGCEHEYDSE